MTKTILSVATALLLSFSVNADEKYDHFPAVESPDLPSALCNLKQYNEMLADITQKAELETLDMVKVHELTYTIEKAIQQMQATLNELAVELEEVHQASERLDKIVIKNSSEIFLRDSKAFIETQNCK